MRFGTLVKHLLSFSVGADASADDVVSCSESDGISVPWAPSAASDGKTQSAGGQPGSKDRGLSLLDCEVQAGSGTSEPFSSFPTTDAEAESKPGAIGPTPKEIVRWRMIGSDRLRREGSLERKTKQQDAAAKPTMAGDSLPSETLQEMRFLPSSGVPAPAEQRIYAIAADTTSILETSPSSSGKVKTAVLDQCPFPSDRGVPQSESASVEGGKTLMKPERKGQSDPTPETKLHASIFAVPKNEGGEGSVAKDVSEITTLPSSKNSSAHSDAGDVPVAPENDSRSAEAQVAGSMMRQLSGTDRPFMESGSDLSRASAGIRRREDESIRPEHQREISSSGPLQGTDMRQEARPQPEVRAHLAPADHFYAASAESSVSQSFQNEAREVPRGAFSTIEAQMNTAPDMRWIHSSTHRAEAGFEDPTLGWVSVRAHTDSEGVHATVVPNSAEAARVLGEHMGALNAHLADRYFHASAITLANPETSWTGQSSHQGMQQENRNPDRESMSSDSAGDQLRPVRPSSSTQIVSDDAGEHGHHWRLSPIDWGGSHVSLLA